MLASRIMHPDNSVRRCPCLSAILWMMMIRRHT
ncbi:hypothetical protein CTA1_662, partial [Colletotrichum tanaceti]